MTASHSHKLVSKSVAKLLREIDNGAYAVPKLQRAFVWSGEKAAMLLDSMVRGLPVGIITVWNAKRRNSHQLPNTLHILPQPADHLKTVGFVLDGQQRLSVLHNVAKGAQRENARHQMVDFTRVVLVLSPESDGKRVEYRKPVSEEYLSIAELLSPAWHSRTDGLRPRHRRYARVVRDLILKYRLGLSVFEVQDLEVARELFIRINSSGTPLAAADKAFARAQRIDLRARASVLRASLGEGWQGISNELILQALALASGIYEVGGRAQDQAVAQWEKRVADGESKQFEKTWRAVSDGVKLARDTLQGTFGVTGTGVLPSQYMIATLAQYCGRRKTFPSFARKQLLAWFWATAVGQRYSGRGFRTNVVKDAKFFRSLAESKVVHFNPGERAAVSDLRSAAYGRRSSVGDAVNLILAARRPRDLLDGNEVVMEGMVSASLLIHRHHVYPRAFLRKHGVSLKGRNSVLNLCLVNAGTNLKVGAKAPWKYLADAKRERWYGAMCKRALLPDLCRLEYSQGRPSRSYAKFLKFREEALRKAIEAAAGGKKIFARD